MSDWVLLRDNLKKLKYIRFLFTLQFKKQIFALEPSHIHVSNNLKYTPNKITWISDYAITVNPR